MDVGLAERALRRLRVVEAAEEEELVLVDHHAVARPAEAESWLCSFI
jgi:hypothetical protein